METAHPLLEGALFFSNTYFAVTYNDMYESAGPAAESA